MTKEQYVMEGVSDQRRMGVMRWGRQAAEVTEEKTNASQSSQQAQKDRRWGKRGRRSEERYCRSGSNAHDHTR